MRAVASELQLDCLRARQQIARPKFGLDRDAQVDERRLILEAPGRRAVVGRARCQPHLFAVAQQGHGAVENGPAVADIAAKRQQRLGHDLEFVRVRISVTPTSLKVAAIGACGLWIVTFTERTRGNFSRIPSATFPAAASISRKRCALNTSLAHSTTLS